MTPFNFLETKIDVPALDRRAARHPHDSAWDEAGGEFDRLVADAAMEPKGRGEGAVDCPAPSSGDAIIQDQQSSDASIGIPDAVAIDARAILQIPDAAPVQVAPGADVSLAASVAAALAPQGDRAIWLPANLGVPAAESPTGIVAANINLNPAAPAVTIGTRSSVDLPVPAASPPAISAQPMAIQLTGAQEASADFAASVADLFELDLPSSGSQSREDTGVLFQTTTVAIRPQQLAAAVTTAANAYAPAANIQVTSGAGAVPAEMTPTATATIQPKEATGVKPAPAEETLTAQADLTTTSTANKSDATILPLPRDFVREVATHYQATADAGLSSRAAGDAAPAEQVTIRLIHSLHEGRKAVQIHLHPSELGSIDVAMQWKGDRLTAHFVADRPETLDLLQRDIRILEQSLGDSGFKSDNGLSFSLRQQTQGQAERHAANGSPSSDRTQNAAPETPADETSTIRDGVLVLRV